MTSPCLLETGNKQTVFQATGTASTGDGVVLSKKLAIFHFVANLH
ncbi:MAG: hypothetical protein ACFFD4_13610 [Candidatus Odinarchaeota archaeon]